MTNSSNTRISNSVINNSKLPHSHCIYWPHFWCNSGWIFPLSNSLFNYWLLQAGFKTWSAGDIFIVLCLFVITFSIALTLSQWGQFFVCLIIFLVVLFFILQLWFIESKCLVFFHFLLKTERYGKAISIHWLACSKWDYYFYFVIPYTFVY